MSRIRLKKNVVTHCFIFSTTSFLAQSRCTFLFWFFFLFGISRKIWKEKYNFFQPMFLNIKTWNFFFFYKCFLISSSVAYVTGTPKARYARVSTLLRTLFQFSASLRSCCEHCFLWGSVERDWVQFFNKKNPDTFQKINSNN